MKNELIPFSIAIYIEMNIMKRIKMRPRQVLMLLKLNMLKEHPISLSGKSAKLLHKYIENK